jgi:uncharacterized damage-inducible protein DinB
MNSIVDQLMNLPDEVLDEQLSARCSMGEGMRGLLVHNLEHDRMHTGQVASQLYYLHRLQTSSVNRLLGEWYRERGNLIALLIGMTDETLDAKSEREEWSVRQMLDHVLTYDRDPVEASLVELRERAALPAV